MEDKSNSVNDLKVTKNAEEQRFETSVEGQLAVIEYEMMGDSVIDFVHTEVPVALEGRGIADHMAHEVLEYARNQGLAVIPQCPFVADYISRHPEYQSLVYSY